jgi:type I restriction enzyme R subunit
VRQIISRAIVPERQVLEVFTAAGLEKPDISILSDQFLDEVRELPQKNVAVELLRKLLSDEIKARRRKNVVEARSFAEMLEQAIRRYQNRSIESAAVIEELIELAKHMREADKRGDERLRGIAQELVVAVRKNVTIDWTIRENVRAQLRVIVKRILRKHGYPPDKQESATQTVLEQAAVLMDGEVADADAA